MIGQPTPALRPDPGEAEPFVPLPLPVAERRPAGRNFRLPGHSEFGRIDPFAICIEVAHAIMQAGQPIARGVADLQLIAGEAPGIGIELGNFRKQVEFVRAGQDQPQHLALGHSQLDRGGAETRLAFQHGELAEIGAGFKPYAAAPANRDLRRRHGQDERIAPIRLTAEVGDASV